MRPLPDPVFIFDLDGTTLEVNSFPHWVGFLLRARFAGLAPVARARVCCRTGWALARRKLGLSDHEALKRSLQLGWQFATLRDGGQAVADFSAAMRRHVRPNLVALLGLVEAGELDAVLATAAAADYANRLGRDLGFRHVLATDPERSAEQGSNVGAAKRDAVLAFLRAQGWSARPRVLLTDHRDDLPLIRISHRTGWFGSAAALAAVRREAPDAAIIYCGAESVVRPDMLLPGDAVVATAHGDSANMRA
jgi:phosphoserine phosphatase